MAAVKLYAILAVIFIAKACSADGGGFDPSSISKWYQNLHNYFSGHGHGHGHSSHSNTDIFGCNNVSGKDHLIALLRDWLSHGDRDAIIKFYYDVALIDMTDQAVALPGSHGKRMETRAGYENDHDEAYTHANTQPDIRHLEELASDKHMNAACRREILRLIEFYIHPSTSAPTTTQKRTHAPPTHVVTHAVHHPSTTKPTTHPPTHPPTPKPTHATHPPTHTHAPQTTTTTMPALGPIQAKACDAITLVTELARTNILSHPLAGFCKDGTRSQSEALVLNSCDIGKAPSPSVWVPGAHVLEQCNRIPKYTPIATFLLGNYVLDGTALSGVLVECTPTGFKMAAQLCGHTPQIYNIQSGGTDPRQNAGSYYVIDW